MIEVDARGLGCPIPVVKTKQALETCGDEPVRVLIERPEGCQNVVRFAESQGCECVVEEKDGLFYITINKGATSPEKGPEQAARPVIVIATDHLGTGSEELGKALLKAFINTLVDAEPKPARLIFLNAGVRLTTEGSEVTDALRQLETQGVDIFSCGTCLDYYGLKERLQVGAVTNMYDTVDTLLSADKVIRI